MSLEEIGRLALVFQKYSLAFPILIGLYKIIRGSLSKNLLVLLFLLILFIPLELLTSYFASMGNNLFFVGSSRIIGLLLYITVFYLSTKNIFRRRLYVLLTIIYCMVLLLEVIFSPRDLFLQYANFLFNFTLIVAAISHLLEIVEDDFNDNILGRPMFWISAGILLNNAVLMIALFANNYFIANDMIDELWISTITKLVFGVALYLFIAVGFWKSRPNHQ